MNSRSNRLKKQRDIVFFLMLLLGGLFSGFFLYLKVFEHNQIKQARYPHIGAANDVAFERLRNVCESNEDRKWNITCLQKELSLLAWNDLQQAIQIAEMLKNENIVDLGECHVLAHKIGEAAVDHYGTDAALRLLTPFCTYGYVHGIFDKMARIHGWLLEEYARNGGDMCSKLSTEPNESFAVECFHALGHGVINYAPRDLLKPLQACDQTSMENRDRRQCYGGVFMALTRPNQGFISEDAIFYDPKDPFYPCGLLEEFPIYKHFCLFEVSQRAIHAKIPYPDVIPFCEAIEDQDAQKVCLNQLYGSIAHNPASIYDRYQLCRSLGGYYIAACLERTIDEYRNNRRDFGDAAIEFCRLLDHNEKTICTSKESL